MSALDPKTGMTLFRLARRLPPNPPFGVQFLPPLSCPPQATLDGKLILRFSEGLYAIDPKLGQILWMQRFSNSKEPAVDPVLCAAVTPDSGAVVIEGRRKNVAKYDARGELAWKTVLPLDGAALSIPQVDPVTGDVLVRISAHLVCLDATGQLKWTRPMDDANERAPSPEADRVDQE